MAINPGSLYPGKTTAPNADYPYGSARNVTTPGDGTGTPWEAALVNDIFGFQQALLDNAGIVPSGTPERVGVSQYLDAIRSLTVSRVAAPADLIEGAFDGQRVDLADGTAAGYTAVQWDADSTATDDGKYVFQVSGVATGRWVAVGAKGSGLGIVGSLPEFPGFATAAPSGLYFSSTKPADLPAEAPTGSYVVFQPRDNHYLFARNTAGTLSLYYGVAADNTTAPTNWLLLGGGGDAVQLLAERDIRYAKNSKDTRLMRAGYDYSFTNRRVLFEPNAGNGELGNMRPNLLVANSPLGKYHLYYNIDRGDGRSVGPGDTDIEPALATSDDLVTWTFQNYIGAASGVSFLGVVDFNVHYDAGLGKYVAFYVSGQSPDRVFRRAESDDGLAFGPSSVVISFGSDDARYPGVLQFGGMLYLYYMFLNVANWEIRMQYSLDGGFNWTEHPDSPVMQRIASLAYEDTHVFDPHPIIVDNMVLMGYTAGGSGNPYGATFTERLAVATSYDGVRFGRSNANPILSPTNNPGDPDEMWCIDPNLFFDGDTLYVIYTGQDVDAGAAGIRRLMIAEAVQA